MMPLFTIDIGTILSSPVGTMEEFHFAQEIPADMWDDLVCESELSMHIKLLRQDFGIECIFVTANATITVPSESIENKEVEIENISREFHIKKLPTDPDDIQYIDLREGTIDLTRMVEEELLIAGL